MRKVYLNLINKYFNNLFSLILKVLNLSKVKI